MDLLVGGDRIQFVVDIPEWKININLKFYQLIYPDLYASSIFPIENASEIVSSNSAGMLEPKIAKHFSDERKMKIHIFLNGR